MHTYGELAVDGDEPRREQLALAVVPGSSRPVGEGPPRDGDKLEITLFGPTATIRVDVADVLELLRVARKL